MDVTRLAAQLGSDRLALAVGLAERAAWVQARLDQASELGVDQHEETLTQSVLLDLRARLPELGVKVFTRQEENRASGADWLWWWRGRDRWFGHLVQAKRLIQRRGGGAGYGVGYRPARRSADGDPAPLQIDTLLHAADVLRVPAIFALYNPSTPGQRLADDCPYIAAGDPTEGVTIIAADVVKYLLTAHSNVSGPVPRTPAMLLQAEIAQNARPWSCLATCARDTCWTWPRLPLDIWRALDFPQPPEADDLAFGAAVTVLLAQQSGRLRQLLRRQVDVAPHFDRIRRGVREEPPAAVELALGSGDLASDSDAALSDYPENVRGIVVISQRVSPDA